MLILCGGLGYMAVMRKLHASPRRLGFFAIFAGLSLFATSLRGGSFASLAELLVFYGCWTFQARVSLPAYRLMLRRFILFMTVPAVLVIVQYTYQKVTGLSNPLNMTYVVPQGLILKGFDYIDHYPWNSSFIRPNGFFFLEPSFIAAFTASATVIEISYFRRWYVIALMAGATVMSFGATGVVMLGIAAPFLLVRESPGMIIATTVVAVVVILLVLTQDVTIPLLSRVGELHHQHTSGGERLVVPATQLMTKFFDSSYWLFGNGPGSTITQVDWPFVKLLNEYGVLTMLAFGVYYFVCLWPAPNRALNVSLSIIFLFTGGYLLNAMMVDMVFVLLFAIQPLQPMS